MDQARLIRDAGDLLAKFGEGIEADATMIEIRLALAMFRRVPDRPDWRLFLPAGGNS